MYYRFSRDGKPIAGYYVPEWFEFLFTIIGAWKSGGEFRKEYRQLKGGEAIDRRGEALELIFRLAKATLSAITARLGLK